MATTSEKGTLIRIFLSETGQQIQELRRGAEKAVIYSLAFNHSGDRIACSSDKGTVHVFFIDSKKAVLEYENSRRSMAMEEHKKEETTNKKHT